MCDDDQGAAQELRDSAHSTFDATGTASDCRHLGHVYSRAMNSLRREIERLFALGAHAKGDASVRSRFEEFLSALSLGKIRAAEKSGNQWATNAWVKQGILLGFRIGDLKESGDPGCLSFVDKDTFPLRQFSVRDQVRIVPGG